MVTANSISAFSVLVIPLRLTLRVPCPVYCDRRSVDQFVLESDPFETNKPDFNFLCLTILSFFLT
jgi:hypothetical protein